jgi:PII-like signaling protein
MSLTGNALRMTVFIGENDQVHHRPLYSEIVHRAHARGLAGATVLRGHEGFGASNRIHTTRILSLVEDLPVLVVIIDEPAKVRDFLPEIETLVRDGMITLDEVEVIRLSGGAHAGSRPGSAAAG